MCLIYTTSYNADGHTDIVAKLIGYPVLRLYGSTRKKQKKKKRKK